MRPFDLSSTTLHPRSAEFLAVFVERMRASDHRREKVTAWRNGVRWFLASFGRPADQVRREDIAAFLRLVRVIGTSPHRVASLQAALSAAFDGDRLDERVRSGEPQPPDCATREDLNAETTRRPGARKDLAVHTARNSALAPRPMVQWHRGPGEGHPTRDKNALSSNCPSETGEADPASDRSAPSSKRPSATGEADPASGRSAPTSNRPSETGEADPASDRSAHTSNRPSETGEAARGDDTSHRVQRRARRRRLIEALGRGVGLEPGEIARLQWSDIDLDRRIITVPTRDGRGRKRVAMSKESRALLARALRRATDQNAFVFPTAGAPGHITIRTVQRILHVER